LSTCHIHQPFPPQPITSQKFIPINSVTHE
jgi:hypothetical protein